MEVVALIGRILYGLLFLGSGVAGHLMETEGTSGYAEARGLANSKTLVQVSGVLIAAGALGVMLGIFGDLAALGLVAYVIITNVLIHHFWTDGPEMQQNEMTQFMKNIALAGGGLAIFVLFSIGEAGWTLTDPLF